MIKLIIFDFSGTLAHCEAKEYREVFSKLRDFNLPVNEEKTARLEGLLDAMLTESTGWEDFANKIIQKLGIVLEKDRRESLAAFLEKKLGCKLFGDAESVLSLPQDKAILTLSAKFVVDGISELRHFAVFTPKNTGAANPASVESFGVAKPDIEAFLAVLAKMKVDPEEAVMVGDGLENDIMPARAIGIKAILLDRNGKYGKLDDPEIIKISSLKELKKFL
jgi:FMN phosphatase YigB (HAD superfamily)